MKENVLDVLMYLFENFLGEGTPLPTSQETLRSELSAAGFHRAEIDKAFQWLEGLAQQRQRLLGYTRPAHRSLRIYTDHESKRLDVECRGFLLYLEQIGVLDPAHRELAIDRVMALESADIDLTQLKWVVLLVLFNQPGQEAAYAWMEDMVYQGPSEGIH